MAGWGVTLGRSRLQIGIVRALYPRRGGPGSHRSTAVSVAAILQMCGALGVMACGGATIEKDVATIDEARAVWLAVRDQNMEAFAEYFNSLPRSDSRASLPPAGGGDDYWLAAMLRSPRDSMPADPIRFGFQAFLTTLPPDISPMLQRRLSLNGRPLKEEVNPLASGRIAAAGCDFLTQEPRIYVAPDLREKASEVAYPFWRFHEYAHHFLEHVRCEGDSARYPESPAEEVAADSLACRLLEEFEDGVRVQDRVMGELYGLYLPGDSVHPPTRTRSLLIDCDCSGRAGLEWAQKPGQKCPQARAE